MNQSHPTAVFAQPQLPKGWNIGLWILQVFAASLFLFAGSKKLLGAEMSVVTFEQIGLGQWFRYFTGGVEIISAILMLIPRTSAIGALLLAITMACATLTRLFIVGGSPLPAIVLLAVTLIVAWYRRPLSFTRRTLA